MLRRQGSTYCRAVLGEIRRSNRIRGLRLSLPRRRRDGGRLYAGTGISPDIIGACIRAYINALNKIVYEGN